ncbi:MAG: hypothetical protein ABSA46_20590 [Thermodesulfovibrionales bacterium]|jgi:hypothetical protein
MTPDILRKLAVELNTGITTEVQVVYLLAGIRKLIERDKTEDQYPRLKFHCDWALHSSMDRAAAKAILRQFDAAHPLLLGNVELHNLPAPLKSEIDRISTMHSFEEELSKFLAAYGLPLLTQHRYDGWVHFLHLYTKVIEDIPLVVAVPAIRKKPKQATSDTGPKHISHVTVNLEQARETIKHAGGEELLFKVTWTIYDKNGQSGDIFILNSFSLQP